mgnify:FL=1
MAKSATPAIRDRIRELRRVPASELRANPKNWRKHPKAQRDALSGVLAEIGYADALLARELADGSLELVDGHLRADLTPGQLVPVLVLDLDEAEADKVLATLDPLAAMAIPDMDALTALLGSVQFEAPTVNAMLDALAKNNYESLTLLSENKEESFDSDVAIEQVETDNYVPFSKRGQIWQLGRHRVMCGDSTNAMDVGLLLDRAKPLLCVTDPPYGVNYDPGWRNEMALKGHLAYARRRIGSIANDDRADWHEAWMLFPGDVIYSWHPAGATSLVHAAALQASGFEIRMQIIWAKSNFPIGRGDYHVRHEPCWYAVRKGKSANRTEDRTQTTLWQINLDRNIEGGHSTQKPLECMARPIRNHNFEEIYDPFLGSGTTIIAAEKLGRICYAMEILPRYVDVAIRRWEDFTGQKAKLVENA